MTQDVVAMTVEADGTGAIYPVVYVRHDGRLAEHALARAPAARLRHDASTSTPSAARSTGSPGLVARPTAGLARPDGAGAAACRLIDTAPR